jgi:hypothetical protein
MASLMLGNGEAGFLDSDAVELVYGPQGGYHIVLGLRATFIDATGELSATINGTVDGQVLGTCSPSLTMSCNSSTRSLETSGILLIWDPGVLPEDIEGKTATVEVTLTDAAGQTHTATRDFLITAP